MQLHFPQRKVLSVSRHAEMVARDPCPSSDGVLESRICQGWAQIGGWEAERRAAAGEGGGGRAGGHAGGTRR
jgi:hypothetical protein